MVYPITDMVTTCLEVLRRICDDAIATVVLHRLPSADDGGDSVATHEDAADEWADKYLGLQAQLRRAICSLLTGSCQYLLPLLFRQRRGSPAEGALQAL